MERAPGKGRRGGVWWPVLGRLTRRGWLGPIKDVGTNPRGGNGKRAPLWVGPRGKTGAARCGYRSLSPPIISGGQTGSRNGRSPSGMRDEPFLTFVVA